MLRALGNAGSTIAKNAVKADGPFSCPSCNTGVVLKKGKVVSPHFAHRPGSDCTYGAGETELHRQSKQAIYDSFTADSRYQCEMEYTGFDTIRPDIYVTNIKEGYSFGIEIQRSQMTLAEIERRTCEYHYRGVAVLWLPTLDPEKRVGMMGMATGGEGRVYKHCHVIESGSAAPSVYSRHNNSSIWSSDNRRFEKVVSLLGYYKNPRMWERWLALAYGGTVYYYDQGTTVIPVHFRFLGQAGRGPFYSLISGYTRIPSMPCGILMFGTASRARDSPSIYSEYTLVAGDPIDIRDMRPVNFDNGYIAERYLPPMRLMSVEDPYWWRAGSFMNKVEEDARNILETSRKMTIERIKRIQSAYRESLSTLAVALEGADEEFAPVIEDAIDLLHNRRRLNDTHYESILSRSYIQDIPGFVSRKPRYSGEQPNLDNGLYFDEDRLPRFLRAGKADESGQTLWDVDAIRRSTKIVFDERLMIEAIQREADRLDAIATSQLKYLLAALRTAYRRFPESRDVIVSVVSTLKINQPISKDHKATVWMMLTKMGLWTTEFDDRLNGRLLVDFGRQNVAA